MADLIRWNPMDDLFDIQDNINRVFGNYLSARGPQARGIGWMPPVDITESENEYNIKADIPGMKKEDIKISLEDNTLSISGERKEEKEEKGTNFVKKEKSFGSFMRTFALPHSVDAKGIKASYKEGVLNITVPKSEESKPREIKIDIN